MAANPEVLAYVIAAAKQRGINPDVAVKAFMHEGLGVFDPNKPDLGGDENSSFGPFQLHYGGRSKSMPNAGMGDDFTKATGLRADDPSTWKQQTDYVMNYLAKGGSWAPWMGAAAEGITGRTGLPGGGPYSGAVGSTRTSGPVEAAGGGFGNEAAKAAPQLTTADTLAAAVVASQPPPPNPLIDPGDSRGNLASAFTGMAAARGDGDSTGVGELPPPPNLPDVAYANAVPGGGLTASGDAAVGALPGLDLASLFKVAEIGVPQALASRRPKELYV